VTSNFFLYQFVLLTISAFFHVQPTNALFFSVCVDGCALRSFLMLHVRLMSESDQCLYNTTYHRFWELHRLKNAQYIVRIKGGLKNNLCFWEAIKPGTHRALQIYLLGFFKACTCGMIGSWIVTCQLLTTVIKCLLGRQ
jgi:hypothetical protein